MAPSAIAPEVSHFHTDQHTIDFLPIEERSFAGPRKAEENIAVDVKGLFNSALIEKNRMSSGSRVLKAVISATVHVLVIAVPILLSLIYTDTINLKQFTTTLLVAPPPPPPPPPAAAAVVKVLPPKRVFIQEGKLVAPRAIPKEVAMIKEEAIPEGGLEGVTGGVPGGIPGGQMGGVIGGVIGGVLGKGIVPVAPSKPKAPIRVGGHIKAPRAIFQPAPQYPVIARQARITGVVVIDAVLDETGSVIEMKIVSGPPLLYQSAMDAVRQWKYEPTYLNETAIPVQMIVNVTFQLSSSS